MKKLSVVLAVVVISCGVAAAETATPGATGFTGSVKAMIAAVTRNILADNAPAIQPVKAGKVVQVSGRVRLSGAGMVGEPGGLATITMTGSGRFQDSTGDVAASPAAVTIRISVWVYPNQPIYHSAPVSVVAAFYRKGKAVGSARLEGKVNLTGFSSGPQIQLNGDGVLTGSLYVEDGK